MLVTSCMFSNQQEKTFENTEEKKSITVSDFRLDTSPKGKVLSHLSNATSYNQFMARCRYYPESLVELYTKADELEKKCEIENFTKYLVPWLDENKNPIPKWLDPWGRAYQMKFDREKRQFLLRSRGPDEISDADDLVNSSIIQMQQYEELIKKWGNKHP